MPGAWRDKIRARTPWAEEITSLIRSFCHSVTARAGPSLRPSGKAHAWKATDLGPVSWRPTTVK